MPQYFFDVRSHELDYCDPDGITLADDDAAIAYAERMIRELKEDEGYEALDLKMFVKDESRRSIITIRFNPPKVRALGESYALMPARTI
jgi:hypothetical protein